MKPCLTGHHALDLATRAVPVIKHLQVTDRTMTLKEFGQAIGLVRQAWKPDHHQQIATVLSIVHATYARLQDDQLELDRVVYTAQQKGHWYQKRWVDGRATQ